MQIEHDHPHYQSETYADAVDEAAKEASTIQSLVAASPTDRLTGSIGASSRRSWSEVWWCAD